MEFPRKFINSYVRGFTLIELIVLIVVVGVGVSGLVLAIHQATKDSVDPLFQQQARAIAQSYLEEAMLKSYCDPDDFASATTCVTSCSSSACVPANCGTNTEASRDLYDNVCDYDAITSESPPVDQSNTALAALADYTVDVSVIDSGFTLGTGAGQVSANSGEVVRVDVQVQHASGVSSSVSGYRVNY